MERFKEWLAIKIAWAMPKRLAMWAFYRVAAHATQGPWGNQVVDTVSIMDAAGRWETA